MKKLLVCGLLVSSLVALAQGAPKAVLLRIDSGDEVHVVGALEGSKWAVAEKLSSGSVAKIKSGLKTVMFNLKGTVGKAMAGGKFEVGQCDWNRTTSFSTPVKLEFPTYAIDAAWNPSPRAFKVLPSNNPTYLQAVQAELKRFKNPKPARISQIIQADLDNDKQLEVLIVAQSSDGVVNDTGEYSLVLVRKVVAGKVQTFRLEDYYIQKGYDPATDTGAQQGATNRISAIADIDGNGSMEVFVDGEVHEGYGVTIYSWNGKGFVKLIDWGCGV